VLLKGLENDAFVFYTNYQSAKALHILKTPFVALNFYWPQMARQVRIRGQVEQTTSAQSDAYFSTRPKLSQLSALSSPQSQIVEDRSVLETRLNAQVQKYQESPVPRPEHWGGYKVVPDEIEFWQGRDNRLHDRLHYKRYNNEWRYHRLAP
jgi:pyridoxamine 5'-phosphate oxidase